MRSIDVNKLYYISNKSKKISCYFLPTFCCCREPDSQQAVGFGCRSLQIEEGLVFELNNGFPHMVLNEGAPDSEAAAFP